ncbi:MAG: hypothetical protein J0H16_18250, partial [Alicycliphilus denitrificans]|nr:hypothetical protein [Alicycliphilus denitrificans]
HLVHLIEKDLLAGLLGQWVQTQGVLIHGAIVLDAWRWGGSDGEVLQTFPRRHLLFVPLNSELI